jgi:hypothetical protein
MRERRTSSYHLVSLMALGLPDIADLVGHETDEAGLFAVMEAEIGFGDQATARKASGETK